MLRGMLNNERGWGKVLNATPFRDCNALTVDHVCLERAFLPHEAWQVRSLYLAYGSRLKNHT